MRVGDRVAALACALTTLAGDSGGAAGAAGDPAYGAYLAAECRACHGADAGGAIPPLTKLAPEQLAVALAEYRDGRRDNPVMQAVARSLGEAEIAALAAYLASRP